MNHSGSPKRGFVLYFDSYPALAPLPYEQQGMLFSALFRFADQICRNPDPDWEEALEPFPQLSAEARLAFRFIASYIARDTRRWLERREQNQKYRSERKAAAQGAPLRSAQDRRPLPSSAELEGNHALVRDILAQCGE